MTVNIHALKARSKGEKYWNLPTWGHVLGNSVFPIVMFDNEIAIPIGTGFAVSQCGLVLTATHVVDQAFKNTDKVSETFRESWIKSEVGRTPNGKNCSNPIMILSIQHKLNSRRGEVVIGDSGTVNTFESTDVAAISLDATYPERKQQHLWSNLPLSPFFPRRGEKVYCVGHCNYRDASSVSVDEFAKLNRKIYKSKYLHDFRVSSGVVTDVYTKDYVNGYVDGPCFRVDCKLEHGQSGGPVINSKGYVCGINMAGTLFDEEDSCLAAPIWPSLGGKFNLAKKMAARAKIPQCISIMNMIDRGLVETDETIHDKVTITMGPDNVGYFPPEVAVSISKAMGIPLPEEALERLGDMTRLYADRQSSEK